MSVQRSSCVGLLSHLIVVAGLLMSFAVRNVWADEIWVAPTYQADTGGVGVASNTFWPASPLGAARFAWGIPDTFQGLQSAKIVLIPHAPGGAATLYVYICQAQNGNSAASRCAGPFRHDFTGVVNRLTELDITTDFVDHLGPPNSSVAVLAYTAPTTQTDHMVGLRFVHRGDTRVDFAKSNTALGYHALQTSTGTKNTAVGATAMLRGASGSRNTAVGETAMFGDTIMSGDDNTALGQAALEQLTTGSRNTAIGVSALRETHANTDNTAVGAGANFSGGGFNTAVGSMSLFLNNGDYNAALGFQSLGNNYAGDRNTAVGAFALQAPGPFSPNNRGFDNVGVGYRAGISVFNGHHNIYIANEGLAESNTLRLGTAFDGTAGQNRVFIAGIRGVTTDVADAVPVTIDSNGQLGTVSSSVRFKEDIRDMSDASRRLHQLRPVTFRYTRAYRDGSKPLQFGLVAEEVAEVFPELAVRNVNGQIETVHYETLNVLLLNELQKQQQRIDMLERRLEQLLDDIPTTRR